MGRIHFRNPWTTSVYLSDAGYKLPLAIRNICILRLRPFKCISEKRFVESIAQRIFHKIIFTQVGNIPTATWKREILKWLLFKKLNFQMARHRKWALIKKCVLRWCDMRKIYFFKSTYFRWCDRKYKIEIIPTESRRILFSPKHWNIIVFTHCRTFSYFLVFAKRFSVISFSELFAYFWGKSKST